RLTAAGGASYTFDANGDLAARGADRFVFDQANRLKRANLGGAGAVDAWGKDANGELGNNSTTTTDAPVQVLGVGGTGTLTNVVALAAGGDGHSLALKADGTVWAWGANAYGQLGDNTTTERHTPVQVLGVGGSGVLTGVV